MTQTSRQALGAAGERLARRHLEREGYRFVAANWRCPRGELDLIMQDEDALVFVEVKTRHGERFGAAEEAISRAKAARLILAAQRYVMAQPALADTFWRIDLVAVTLDHSGAIHRINHVVDAVRSG